MEIVIVDNNSQDGSQVAIETYLKEHHVNYKYYYSEENLGVAGGRSLAFKMSDGEYIFFLDDDAVVVTDNIFVKVCTFMEQNENVVALALNAYEPATNSYLLGATQILRNCNYQLTICFIGVGHVLRKSFFSSLGELYPSKLHFGSEEYYASLKAWGAGKEIAYVPEFKIHHMPSVINRYVGKERDFNFLINIYIIKKLVFPNVVMPFVYFVFIIRIIKNGFWTKDWRARIKREIFQRYNKNEEYKIPLKTLFFLMKTFGFNDIL
jgi:GT2 family glycosyltransferase